MEAILHQLIGSLSHYLRGFIYPRWCRISSINSITVNLPCSLIPTWFPKIIAQKMTKKKQTTNKKRPTHTHTHTHMSHIYKYMEININIYIIIYIYLWRIYFVCPICTQHVVVVVVVVAVRRQRLLFSSQATRTRSRRPLAPAALGTPAAPVAAQAQVPGHFPERQDHREKM